MPSVDSEWLIQAISNANPNPQKRLLALFDILAEWLVSNQDKLNPPGINPLADEKQTLLNFLIQESTSAGADSPEALAYQLFFMAKGALHEAIRMPQGEAFTQAKYAAITLIKAQTSNTPSKKVRYSIVLLSTIIITALTSYLLLKNDVVSHSAQNAQQPLKTSLSNKPSPAEMAELYKKIELMRSGVCRFPEALMLPDKQKSVYIENIVQGVPSADTSDTQLMYDLLKQIQCDYAPMLMKNSK